ncbi:MAG: tRNA glutamyl-Q(34) synthetase GluQRS [Halothiobacillaceae bacterium]|nr:MAG: tRNA glutamyl-Q(34) synthetase GluQRS [Halothiobacillaceae bacterium]
MYIGRFAPTPSGPLHFGSLIAALASFLDARASGGRWLVRIEDLDPPRCMPGASDMILRQLEAHGLGWDGKVVHQSARTEAYREALEQLRGLALAYPCTCSRSAIRASASRMGREGPIDPGTCRTRHLKPGHPHAMRLDTRGAVAAFEDRLHGLIQQDIAHELGDFVIWRVEDLAAYHLAVVVDDAWQGVTDVVRGSDLLDSTPRQVWLQGILGLPQPRHMHLPLALAANGQKLSKQNLAPPLSMTQPTGQLIEALRFLGQPATDELVDGTPGEILDWAVRHWRPSSIPRAASPA